MVTFSVLTAKRVNQFLLLFGGIMAVNKTLPNHKWFTVSLHIFIIMKLSVVNELLGMF
jgi:hypothetical protein